MGHKYDYQIDLNDDGAPARVVRMAGRGKRVLEIGAGPGSMTRVLRDSFGCRITALEIDESVIPSLTPFCEQVYRVDLNNPAWPEALASESKFDVIILADVLEHLYDPWTLLPRLKNLLAEDGYIVVSIPHTGHNAVIACLLGEDVEYRDAGLLDKTHIRFFGMKNIQALFDNAGLAITLAEFVVRLPEETEFAAAWDRLPGALRTQLLKNEFGDVYQVVAKVVPMEFATERISLLGLRTPPLPAGSGDERVAPVGPSEKVRLMAFFLPQFHPTPENNLWWGKGFTEWTNVTKAEPLFAGHYQPHLPADLGFYDLRLRETRHEQIALAKEYGIDGFCYYYYWFSGTRILNRPLDDMLRDPESDMPFCLCWANENWTRRWDGADHEILIAQKYLPTDDLEFIRSVIPFFNDSRYIRLNGAPFLIVYQPQHLPDPQKALDSWREYCEQAGVGPIHLCAALTNDNENYAKLGFDSGLQFPPHNRKCGSVNDQVDFYTPFHGCVVEYADLAQSYLDESYPHSNVFRTVSPSWDQTARVGSRAFITLNGTPANYEYWLKESIRRTTEDFPAQDRFVFINAWNEWAEGCHLEPDRRFQRQFLEATLRVKTNRSEKHSFEDKGIPTPVEPVTSAAARLNDVQQDLAIEARQRETAEQDLAEERKRLAAVYEGIEKTHQEAAKLQREVAMLRQELTSEREAGSKLASDLSVQRETQEEAMAALEQQLQAVKQELSAAYSSLSWRLTRFLRG
ncbi:MAG TPA: glycoside hydrolase family 99-like domain-containing protein [Terriglobia bacterium]|jgi:2-polyprenyl-3-methyl-5-hydroxy-6-metoxy-1,4-benzoquinol methylase